MKLPAGIIALFLLAAPLKGQCQQKQLPDLHFTDTEHRAVSRKDLPKGKGLLLIYFRSDCDHCIHTSVDLRKNASRYPCEIWMVSGEDYNQVENFESMMGLYDPANVKVLLDQQHQMHRFFDFTQLPFIVLYNANGRQLKTFTELPSPEIIRKILNSK